LYHGFSKGGGARWAVEESGEVIQKIQWSMTKRSDIVKIRGLLIKTRDHFFTVVPFAADRADNCSLATVRFQCEYRENIPVAQLLLAGSPKLFVMEMEQL
jgi:hypothetical protein